MLAGFHLLLCLQIWSFLRTILTDPGQVPPYWGFSICDSETKRKRYCLMCHVFKPERCHHCSICNRCVLNMDHHCPWVNNCIGFGNRKFFVLLLVYSLLVMCYMIGTMFERAYQEVVLLSVLSTQTSPQPSLSSLPFLCFYLFLCILTLLLTGFSKFHLHLVLTNSTTIETLEQPGVISKYTLGPLGNWRQVFGRNPWLWLLPMTGKSGKPVGDGVTWVDGRSSFHSEENHPPIEDDINTVESPRISPPMHRSVPINVQLPELINTEGVSVRAGQKQEEGKGRHSDVETDSSMLTNAVLMKGASITQEDSCLREMSSKLDSPLQSPSSVFDVSLKDPAVFQSPTSS